jgi:hypothetical protein
VSGPDCSSGDCSARDTRSRPTTSPPCRRSSGDRNPIATGASWGVGHSLPILLLGGVFLALDIRIPGMVATGFELVVAAILVALGLRVLAGREALGVALLRHAHLGRQDEPTAGHAHVTLGDTRIGLAHSHADGESLAVGVVHGLAGSGGVVVALAAAAPTVARGVAFLAGFAVASVAAMGAATWAWGRAVGHAGALRHVAGVASVGVGLLLFAEIVGVTVPV